MDTFVSTLAPNPVTDQFRRAPYSAKANDVRRMVERLDAFYAHNTLEFPWDVVPRVQATMESKGWTIKAHRSHDFMIECYGVAGEVMCAILLPMVDCWPHKADRVNTVAMLTVVHRNGDQYVYPNLGDACVDIANGETTRGKKLADKSDLYDYKEAN